MPNQASTEARRCSGCGEVKALTRENFSPRDPKSPFPSQRWDCYCRPCRREVTRKRGRVTAIPKRCPMCNVPKPRTEEHWKFRATKNGKRRIDGYCKECQLSSRQSRRDIHAIKNSYAAEVPGRSTPDKALAAFRRGVLSTERFFAVMAEHGAPEKALEIVNQERAAHGLPAMSL